MKLREIMVCGGRGGVPGVAAISPFNLIQRITLQQGVFLCSTDITRSFEENLQSMEGCHDKVIKILIPNKKAKEFLGELRRMNVSRAILFPGLDGFAQSLKINIPSFGQ